MMMIGKQLKPIKMNKYTIILQKNLDNHISSTRTS